MWLTMVFIYNYLWPRLYVCTNIRNKITGYLECNQFVGNLSGSFDDLANWKDCDSLNEACYVTYVTIRPVVKKEQIDSGSYSVWTVSSLVYLVKTGIYAHVTMVDYFNLPTLGMFPIFDHFSNQQFQFLYGIFMLHTMRQHEIDASNNSAPSLQIVGMSHFCLVISKINYFLITSSLNLFPAP